MKKIIETERLYLRELNSKDAIDFYSLNSDPRVIQFTGDISFKDISEAEEFLRNYNEYNKHGFGRWAVILKMEDKFIGWCGLKFNEEDMVDLGFRFYYEYWNKGYATESAIGCVNYGFDYLKLNEIIGRTLKENIASIKVLEKIGMKFWKSTVCHGNQNCFYYRIKNKS